MARRYIGDAVVTIEYKGGPQDEYVGTVSVPDRPMSSSGKRLVWKFDSLYAPRIGFGQRVGYDSPEAYDEMAKHAVAFGSYYTTHNRGDDVPDWAPDPEVADAIEEATSIVQDDQGEYEVRRRK